MRVGVPPWASAIGAPKETAPAQRNADRMRVRIMVVPLVVPNVVGERHAIAARAEGAKKTPMLPLAIGKHARHGC
jgi:hypothetical protein